MSRNRADDPPHLVETALESLRMWQGRLLDVWRDTVRLPNGQTATREYIRHPGAVVVIAIDHAQRVVLERQYRHPVGEVVVELPAGKLDSGEEPLACAQRELQEETGFTAASWCYLGSFWPCIGYSNEVIHVALARDITPGERMLDEGEHLDVFLLPLATLLDEAKAGRIRDGKTLSALWFALPFLSSST
ncbi:NUDIX domain-containing protein [Hydrogenophilus islandicus]